MLFLMQQHFICKRICVDLFLISWRPEILTNKHKQNLNTGISSFFGQVVLIIGDFLFKQKWLTVIKNHFSFQRFTPTSPETGCEELINMTPLFMAGPTSSHDIRYPKHHYPCSRPQPDNTGCLRLVLILILRSLKSLIVIYCRINYWLIYGPAVFMILLLSCYATTKPIKFLYHSQKK